MEVRLQKYMAECGIASRRASELMILEGRVQVNHKVVKVLGTKIDPNVDLVAVDGKTIHREENKVYYMLYKPAGYLTTVTDPEGRPTIYELLVGIDERVVPVGRLDLETEGLLLLTNDGDFAYRLMHPKFQVQKTYIATVAGDVTAEELRQLRQGILLEDGMTQPAKALIVRQNGHKSVVELTIAEGKKRQVRRMFDAIGHPVMHLKRTAIGKLQLKQVDKGAYRALTDREAQDLKYRLQLG